ncbi:dihydrolipoyllysine-residue succinyltransferase component of 2-oxoglutarate dehydrogenase [Plasmopara halstedii]|uniref:dihydrolipoyllysine-residue succinyltransferase n=1 Tax=Plasmopara halstedii TaxID=4781 RepID=A0A0P1AF88_PLAHL|nr:dihydrolipoyllysine-residue succinyltransferase component of 2-oxoglutarate dehydrogenase [Plasmopara halstedii]CEG39750.1 dihydrolipoyllysine-residue succinyltransferase component of 2-oxoglutarate dehydrogenase [Plasmopara halstedii]|eukprot:XP_024576119.1 dihydrolipoyllysine-residue succinyltransferase component of 2-oxoglutarate dehydrogenase [Plasmopara halstedii]
MHGSGRVVLHARATARANGAARRSLTSLARNSTIKFARSSKLDTLKLRDVNAISARTHRFKAASILQLRAFSSSNEVKDVPVPSMGDSISEGTVVEWLKQPGDAVAEDEVVVVLETDKVSVDVRSPFAGTMGKQLAATDDNVTVGSSLFQIVKGEAGSQSAQSTETKAVPASTSAGEETIVPVPSMGDSISEGTVVEWIKKVGDYVSEDEVVVVLETDKVSVDVRAPKSGTISKTLADVDQTVEIGVPLFSIKPGGEASTASKVAPTPTSAPTPEAISTSSPNPKASTSVATPNPVVPGANPLIAMPKRAIRREKMSRMRLRTAERLKESQNTAASLTTFQEVDMSKLMDLRKQYKDAFEAKHGVKLGFMSAFVKASASALLEVPGVNAMIDDEHQEIVYRDYVDMSVAVSTPKGLVTPVLKNTESMSFADVEKKLSELAIRARDGKLSLEEMTGGNFTISNGGVFGSLMGTPIINLPQSGILGMHNTKMRPVVVNGEVVARPMMYLALTYDHRLVDGREGVTCLKAIADKIENPERLLLDI